LQNKNLRPTDRTMHDLNDLYYFAQVVQHGGFAPTARALGMQKSKLSRRIGILEERLGVRLIHRSSRRFSVTDVGQEYYRHCMAMLVEAAGAQAIIDNVKSAPQGVIRMACPSGLLLNRLGASLARFMADNPKIEMHVKALNRRVDVVGEGFDIAIRVGQPIAEPTTLATRKLGEVSRRFVASPKLFERRAPPETPPELAGFPTVDFGLDMSEPAGAQPEWRLEREGGPVVTVPYRPRLITDDLWSVREAALAGIGIALLPSLMVSEDVDAGRLAVLLPRWRMPNEGIYAMFPSRRGLLPSIRSLLDFLVLECLPYRHGTLNEASAKSTPVGAHRQGSIG